MRENGKNRPFSRMCGAKTRKGATCRRPAGWGTDHNGFGNCKFHFGSTPNNGTAARKAQATEAVIAFGLPREVDPHTALIEEVRRTAGAVSWLQEKIQSYIPDDLIKAPEAGDQMGPLWLSKYKDERRHMVEVCRTAIACGIAERQVQQAEHLGAIVAEALRRSLKALGHEVTPEVLEVVSTQLRLVEEAAG